MTREIHNRPFAGFLTHQPGHMPTPDLDPPSHGLHVGVDVVDCSDALRLVCDEQLGDLSGAAEFGEAGSEGAAHIMECDGGPHLSSDPPEGLRERVRADVRAISLAGKNPVWIKPAQLCDQLYGLPGEGERMGPSLDLGKVPPRTLEVEVCPAQAGDGLASLTGEDCQTNPHSRHPIRACVPDLGKLIGAEDHIAGLLLVPALEAHQGVAIQQAGSYSPTGAALQPGSHPVGEYRALPKLIEQLERVGSVEVTGRQLAQRRNNVILQEPSNILTGFQPSAMAVGVGLDNLCDGERSPRSYILQGAIWVSALEEFPSGNSGASSTFSQRDFAWEYAIDSEAHRPLASSPAIAEEEGRPARANTDKRARVIYRDFPPLAGAHQRLEVPICEH